MALPSSSRGGARIRVAALHTAEGARNKEDLYAFFNRTRNASSHAGADGKGVSPDWVPDSRAAWTLRGGNPYSLNLEMCGFAGWTRSQWMSTGWVDGCWNPRQMIRNAAAWTRKKCLNNNLPMRWLTIQQFRAGWEGIIDHDLYTDATGDGTHWDVGEGFPVDVFMRDVTSTGGGGGSPGGEEEHMKKEDFTPEVIKQLNAAVWGGAHVPLKTDRETGNREWPETQLFSLRERLTREQLEPIRRDLAELKESGGVDIDDLADRVIARLGDGFATTVADELHRRLSE